MPSSQPGARVCCSAEDHRKINVASLEEKVSAVEKKVHESQYALKFVGAAFSSMQEKFSTSPNTL